MKIDLLKLVQSRLKTLGWYRGFVDGQEGPMTSNAMIRFKEAHGLRARDYIGPITIMTLFGEGAKKYVLPKLKLGTVNEPLWLSEAFSLLGTREVAGSGNNPIIMDWADDLDQWYPGDDVPWCGLFMAHCMAVGAIDEPQGFNRLGARAWRAFGENTVPAYGAIGVFWRTHKTRSYNGHVAFIIGKDQTTYHIIGGNQSDNVTRTRIAKGRLLECRGPKGWHGNINLKPVIGGSLSQNEA